MQIVIDIPDQMYLNAKADILCGGDILVKAIKNGTPLDKIRAEIYLKQYDFMTDKDYDEGIRFGLMLAHQIIDKYKTESEKV